MFEWGTLWGIASEIKDYLAWEEETKVVDRDWLEKSGFQKECENRGYKIRWTVFAKIETRKLEGYEEMFEVDKFKRIRRHIERGGKDKLVLLGKKEKALPPLKGT